MGVPKAHAFLRPPRTVGQELQTETFLEDAFLKKVVWTLCSFSSSGNGHEYHYQTEYLKLTPTSYRFPTEMPDDLEATVNNPLQKAQTLPMPGCQICRTHLQS